MTVPDKAIQREHLREMICDAEQAQDHITAEQLRGILTDPVQFAAWLAGDLLAVPMPTATRYQVREENQ